MRAFLLASVFPALVLALTACGQSETTTQTAEAPPPPPPAAAAPETPPPPPPAAAPASPPPPAAAPAAAPAATASADDAAASAVDLRQGSMKLLAFSNGPVGGMLRGTAPFDAAVVKTAADRVATIGVMLPGVFALDTTSSGVESRSLDTVWTNKADFDAKAQALTTAAQALSAAAETGDQTATLAAAGAVGQACGSCHDDYRAE